MTALRTVAAALGLLFASSACNSSKWPEPMGGPYDPTNAAPVVHEGGPEEVVVIRHADPVQVRRAGANSAFPLTFYEKVQRLRSGSMVLTGPGGRSEILWGPEGTSVVMYNEGACLVGEPTRGEPTMTFRGLTRARIVLAPGDRARLVGDALLRGDPERATGPVHLELMDFAVVRIHNQSKLGISLAFRDALLELSPGQLVDLPVLSAGGAPFPRDPELMRVSHEGMRLDVGGDVERVGDEDAPGIWLRANGAASVRGMGVVLELEPGEQAVFTSLHDPDRVGLPARPPAEPEALEP